ncbi:MAG: hypothetical protein F4038_09450, partial [Chloroflexi bacterium]|nr:hypothetical protein [Chloroflexota bacterium]
MPRSDDPALGAVSPGAPKSRKASTQPRPAPRPRGYLRKHRRPAGDPRPRHSLKLRDDLYRIRVGNWRVFYRLDTRGRTVTITAVRRRNERTYRDVQSPSGRPRPLLQP